VESIPDVCNDNTNSPAKLSPNVPDNCVFDLKNNRVWWNSNENLCFGAEIELISPSNEILFWRFDVRNGDITITTIANQNIWFGMGFNNNNMLGTYAIIIEPNNNLCGNIHERRLYGNGDRIGIRLDNKIDLINCDNLNGQRLYKFKRKSIINDNNYYSFSISNEYCIDIIYAHGINTPILSYHGPNKNINTLCFKQKSCKTTMKPTQTPTSSQWWSFNPTHNPSKSPTKGSWWGNKNTPKPTNKRVNINRIKPRNKNKNRQRRRKNG